MYVVRKILPIIILRYFTFEASLKDPVYNNKPRAEGEVKESVDNDWFYHDGII
jgi:hypothetical protein